MNPFRSSLYWRLLIWFCVANLLVLLLGGLLTRGFIEYTTAREINWVALAQGADQAYENGGAAALADWSGQQRHEGIEATLYEKGLPLYPIRLHASVEKSLPSWLEGNRDIVVQPWPGIYVAVQQIVGDDGHARQLVAFSRTHTRLRPQTRQTILLSIQLVLSLLCIGLLGWWVARSVARPVEALRAATRRMAAGELSARVGRQGGMAHDEIAQLAYDFDAMAERIEALVAHDRGVLQDLSHELRSPLARLHLILDFAQRSTSAAEADSYFRQAEQEIGRLDRMTGEMLTLSRLEGGIPGMNRERLELRELIQDCIARAALEAGARKVSLQLASGQPVMVLGSALLLERALDNLIANAIKFSPEGGSVELAVREGPQFAELSISDRGPGVPDAELEFLFRPFFRGSNAARADGHGMGLAIVQRVVQVHGGDIYASNGLRDGLEVHLKLPLASSADME
ncbi:HAMP domain-containing sensor histidine kinase [Rhodanobacter sp. C03]|uniref:HAMP domain-containing sensor histidine kinase n=1 Tax=Rhodanobacter sp. C03 TaxID=1945858 RepID=UPI000987225E|nr:HAMP domain-containing sensor histidine kinase [Rhodanobacter sp. C03]OOG57192.1 two-component sensor histidine kinase [Rhodanobacter sp. C03]